MIKVIPTCCPYCNKKLSDNGFTLFCNKITKPGDHFYEIDYEVLIFSESIGINDYLQVSNYQNKFKLFDLRQNKFHKFNHELEPKNLSKELLEECLLLL